MKRLPKPSFAAVLPSVSALLLACAAAACNGGGVSPGVTVLPDAPPADAAILSGTVIDLADAQPAAGVEVLAPEGRGARTDAEGRFELRVPIGTAGEVRARASDGREVTLTLLPLARERREIVLHLPAH